MNKISLLAASVLASFSLGAVAQEPAPFPSSTPQAPQAPQPEAASSAVSAGEINAGEVLIKGRIKAKGSSGTVKDATVIDLSNRENNVTSGRNGEFEISTKSRDGKLLIRIAGFEDLEIGYANGGLPDDGNILLEPSPEVVGQGIIRARRKTEVSQQSLQREEMSRIPGTGGDAVRSLQSLPSVLPAGVGSANIVVRGSSPTDNLYFLDRMQLPFVFHFGGLGTVVPTRMLEGIDLFPGGFSSLYGDATGGVVQLRSENKTPDRTSGQFELGLTQASAYVEGNMGGTAAISPAPATDDRIGYRAGFRRTYLEIYSPLIKKFAGDRVTFVTLPQATDYQLILNGSHSSGTWQAYLIGAADRLRLAASSPNADTSDGKSQFDLFNYFETTGLRYSMNLGNGLGLSLNPQQRYVLIRQKIFANKIYVTGHILSVDVALDKRWSPQWSATLGVRPEYARNITDVDAIQLPAGGFGPFFDPDTAPRAVEKRTRNTTSGQVYLDVNYKPTKDLLLNPGFNFLRGPQPSEAAVDPRMASRYSLTEVHALKAAWGYYSKRPQPQFDSPDYGNPKLDVERAIHYVAGVESKLTDSWETDVQVYYKDIFDVVGNAYPNPALKYQNNIKGRSRGIETFLKKSRTGRWYGWLSYAYSKSERQDPKTKGWFPFDYDKPHSFTLINAYKFTGQWEVSSKLQYQSGAPYNIIPGGVYNQNTGRYRAKQNGESTLVERNDGRLPATFQLDMRSDYDILYDTWKLNLYLDIQNATNRANVVGGRNSPDFSSRENVTGAPIIPSVGAIASF